MLLLEEVILWEYYSGREQICGNVIVGGSYIMVILLWEGKKLLKCTFGMEKICGNNPVGESNVVVMILWEGIIMW
jgi:hypothetical protein